jgi:hypothetical protein
MPTLPGTRDWNRKTLRLMNSVLEMARVAKTEALVDLHSPARRCSHCKCSSEVFVRPSGLCAACWGRNVLSAVTKSFRQISGYAR